MSYRCEAHVFMVNHSKAIGGAKHSVCALAIFILSGFSTFVFAAQDSEPFKSDITLEYLLEVLASESIERDALAGITTKTFTEQGASFTYYYSPSLQRSFIVDNEIGRVCKTYSGSEVLSCFPCAKSEVSATCP